MKWQSMVSRIKQFFQWAPFTGKWQVTGQGLLLPRHAAGWARGLGFLALPQTSFMTMSKSLTHPQPQPFPRWDEHADSDVCQGLTIAHSFRFCCALYGILFSVGGIWGTPAKKACLWDRRQDCEQHSVGQKPAHGAPR